LGQRNVKIILYFKEVGKHNWLSRTCGGKPGFLGKRAKGHWA